MNNKIHTIGYSTFELEEFIKTIKSHGITAVADVRSSPYSKFKPEFNKKEFQKELKKKDLAYVFLGQELGARVDMPDCYIDNKVDFKLVAQHDIFLNGIDRIKTGMEKFNIVLMCAEKDPITCHRTILICRALRALKIEILHILEHGQIEKHFDTEQRLLALFGLEEPSLFETSEQRINHAYDLQAEKIAYTPKNEFLEESHHY
jgi:uncharacterized protein (DUF488 family)